MVTLSCIKWKNLRWGCQVPRRTTRGSQLSILPYFSNWNLSAPIARLVSFTRRVGQMAAHVDRFVVHVDIIIVLILLKYRRFDLIKNFK